jgi:serine protease Do
MNIKTLGLGIVIASCLSLNLSSCSATKQQSKNSTSQILSLDIDKALQKSDRVPGSISKTDSKNVGFASGTGEEERIRLFAKIKDGAVKIKTAGGTGSGFIISKDGLVVTNQHVVKNEEAQVANKVTVVLPDGTEIEANVLGVSRHRDLALIRIPNQSRLKFLNLAKPETIKVGQTVYALGSPFGIENVFTAGVLNKIDKSQADLYHDARINHGNSGGPLLNSRGEVIGVNTRFVNEGNALDPSISTALIVDRVSELIADYKGKNSNFVSIANVDKRTQIVELPTTGQAISASFKADDETDERNIHYRNYFFEGKANQKLTIEMSSKQIDPSLALYFIDENKAWHALSINKGVSPQDASARISGVLPKDGMYVAIAKTFQPGETGDYQITATLGE